MSTANLAHLARIAESAKGDPPEAHQPIALGSPVPWDYEGRAAVLANRAARLLDLTTGDGALLERVLDAVPGAGPSVTVAADRRARHLAEARERLGDRADLLRASPEMVPFSDGRFDLILLRHRPFDPKRIAEAIPPGGALLTEQMHVNNWQELRRHFPRAAAPPDDLERMKKVFRRSGFELIDVRIHHRPLVFEDLEHVVRMLAAAQWVVPDFSVEADLEALMALEEDLLDERGIVFTRSRFVLEVQRPLPLD